MTRKQKQELRQLINEPLTKKTIDELSNEINGIFSKFHEQMSRSFLRTLCLNLLSNAKTIQHKAFWYRFMKLNRLKEDDTHYIDMIIDSKKEIGMLVDSLRIDKGNIIEAYILPKEGVMCDIVVNDIIIK